MQAIALQRSPKSSFSVKFGGGGLCSWLIRIFTAKNAKLAKGCWAVG